MLTALWICAILFSSVGRRWATVLGIAADCATEARAKLARYLEGDVQVEGLFVGHVGDPSQTGAGLSFDEDMQILIDTWIVKGKYANLLELWVRGPAVDWIRCYAAEKPRRIHAPTYPFAHLRCNGNVGVASITDSGGDGRTSTERALCAMWSDLIGVPKVGVRDDFFALGGNSLIATQLISRVRATLGIEVPVTLIFESPVVEAMARGIDALALAGGILAAGSSIVSADRGDWVPLSYLQERLWFVHEHMPDQRTSYNIAMSLQFDGPGFSMSALRAAFAGLVERHESLRTLVRGGGSGGAAAQVIGVPWEPEIALVDVAAQEVRAHANRFARHDFDLGAGPLLTAVVLRVSADRHVLVTNIHHIISDGWSLGVMIRDLQRLYQAHVCGTPAALPSLPVQYADYAIWQREQDLGGQLAYWTSELEGYQDGLELPYDRPRSADRSWQAATLQYRYPPELAQRVAALSRERQSTLFMSLVSGLALVLHRYSGRYDLCIGTTVAGRDYAELEDLIGFFINILPIRLDLSGNPRLDEVLERTRGAVLRGFEHQGVPFEHVLNALRKQRDSSQIPLVPVVVRHQNFPFAQVDRWSEDVTLSGFELVGDRTTPTEMDWQFFGDGETLELVVEYAADLFDEATVRRMAEHHQLVLERLLEEPERRLDALELLTPRERGLLDRVNATGRGWADAGTGIVELFERQVVLHSGSAASVGSGGLSYGELNVRANRIAHALMARGVGPEVPVVVLCERSSLLLAALMGVFKAGGCYVPVDMGYPAGYVAQILADVRPQVVLAQRGAAVPAEWAGATLWLEAEVGESAAAALAEVRDPPLVPVLPQQLACILYTSGSTGAPKGVMVPHAQIENWLRAAWERWPAEPGEVMLQKTSVAFAVSVKELLSGLLAGMPQLLLGEEEVRDAARLAAAVARWDVTRIHLVPSHLKALLEGGHAGKLGSLRLVVTAGEPLPRAVAEQALGALPGAALWNNYGCTELNDTTYHRVEASDVGAGAGAGAGAGTGGGYVPIGWPLANTRVHVLDANLRPVPLGAMGELCVESVGLARGYREQPGLTAERFVANPYGVQGSRLYRTGDMVRHLPDGQLEYLGRQDHEVKIRGYRIDLRQVSQAIAAHPDVGEQAVLGWPRGGTEQRLVAYVALRAGETLPPGALAAWLRDRLPTYMVPSLIEELPRLPRLANGKIDYLALPEPRPADTTHAYTAPRNPREHHLAAIFADVLGIPKVGIHDNFFALGGHSLLAAQIIARINSELDLDWSISRLFRAPTIVQLLGQMDDADGQDAAIPPAVSINDPAQPVPSFAQERMWFLERFVKGVPYNNPGMGVLTGELDVDALHHAFVTVIERHAPLRTNFVEEDGHLVANVGDARRFVLPITTLSDADSLDRHVRDELALRFDLDRDLLIRARLFRERADKHFLLVTVHHIACDGWSSALLFREISTLYAAYRRGVPPALPTLRASYDDHARWERAYFQGEVLERKLAYWRELLNDAQPLCLPTARPRPALQSFDGGVVRFTFEPDLTVALRALCVRTGTTLYMVLLSAWGVLLSRYSGQHDFCIGSPVANRRSRETHDLIGLFVNTLVMRLDTAGNPRFVDLLRLTQRNALEAYEHQDVPFEMVVDALQIRRDTARSPFFQVVLNLQNMPVDTLRFDGMNETETHTLDVHNGTAKFEMTLDITQTNDGLAGFVEYASALFDEAFVRRMLGHLMLLLRSVCTNTETRIDELQLLTTDERDALLPETFVQAVDINPSSDLRHCWRLSQQHRRSAVPIVNDDRNISVVELGERVDRLAVQIRKSKLGQGGCVAIYAERSIDLVCAILAVWQVGSAYIPIDSAQSPDSIYDVLHESRADVVLTQSHLLAGLPRHGQTVICLDVEDRIDRADAEQIEAGILPDADSAAYVNFGRTGAALEVSHRVLFERLNAFNDEAEFTNRDRFLLQAHFDFDFGTLPLFGWLLCGGSLQIDSDPFDPARLADIVLSGRVTVLTLLPSQLASWLAHLERNEAQIAKLAGLRLILCAGEAFPPGLAGRWQALVSPSNLSLKLIGFFGTREVGYAVTAIDADVGPDAALLGRASGDSRLCVLDAGGQLVPVGIPGLLYVAGRQTARFIEGSPTERPTVNCALPGASSNWLLDSRFRSTGDKVRRLENGSLEWMGRADDADHRRDPRVDLRLIDAQLRRIPEVSDVVSHYQADADGAMQIVAYVVVRHTLAIGRDAMSSALESALRGDLPDYMLPAAYVFLDRLPLTGHGRIDRSALPRPERLTTKYVVEYVAPRNETETLLTELWQQVLRVERVGVRDDFFDRGGYSLLAIQLVALVRKTMGIEVPVTLIFESPVVEAMARGIDALALAGGILAAGSSIVSADRGDWVPLSYLQERLWFVHEHMPDQRTSYNIAMSLQFDGPGFSMSALRAAFAGLVERHESLRTLVRGGGSGGAAAQVIGVPWEPEIALVDVAAQEVRAHANRFARHDFDLGAGPLLTAVVLRVSADRHVLVTNIHHIISDGWSLGVMIRDLQRLYQAHVCGTPAALPSLPVQYADYAIWQREQDLGGQLAYWTSELEGYQDGLELPYDRPRSADRSWQAATLQYRYPPELAQRVAALSRERQSTLFMSLVSGLALVLHRYSGRYDLCIGTTVAGRDYAELEDLIGFFINILPIRLDLSGNPRLDEVLERTRGAVLRGFEHQGVPFEHVLNALRKQRDSSQIPLVPVVVRHQNFPFAQVDRWSEDVTLSGFELVGDRTTPTEMDWQFFGDGETLELVVEYAADLFDEATVRRMAEHHQLVLERLLEEPERRLDALELLTPRERGLLDRVNATGRGWADAGTGIVELFERQVVLHSGSAASVGSGGLSYGELNVRANRIAHALMARGVGPEVPVVLCFERSSELLAGLLGIWKAGGCYVPLDPEYPASYLAQIVEDAHPAVVLADRTLAGRLGLAGERALYLDDAEVMAAPEGNPGCRCAPSSLLM